MERVKLGELTWTDYQSKDVNGDSAFYEELLGWTHEDMPTGEGRPDYRMFYKDGVVVAACNQMSPDMVASGMPPFWAVYVATPDIEATIAKAEELGGTVIMPLMDVLDSGRMVAIADPTGGSIFFWQKKDFAGAGKFMAPGAISWADLSTRDPEGAGAFYSELLGWEIKPTDMGPMPYWQVYVDGEGQGGIMPMPEMVGDEVPPFWIVYFGVADIDASVAKAVSLGATVITPPAEIGGGVSFSVVSDPAGATFALLGPMEG
jgi:hypothetical protein